MSSYLSHLNYYLEKTQALKNKSKSSVLFKAMRPHLLVFSVFPLLSVVVYAVLMEKININILELVAIVSAALMAHVSVFFYWDYYQYKSGESFVIGKENNNIIASGLVSPVLIRNISSALLLTSLAVASVLVYKKPSILVLFLFMGLFFTIAYTYSIKKSLFYILGELSIFLCFGPLLVNGGYFYFSNKFDLNIFVMGLVFGTASFIVYQNNSIENIIYDDKNKKHSLMRSLGFDKGKKFIAALEYLIMIYIILFVALLKGAEFALLASPLVYFLYIPFINKIKSIASPLSSKVLDLKMEMVKLQGVTTVLIICTVIAASLW